MLKWQTALADPHGLLPLPGLLLSLLLILLLANDN
jgi:hypothetical protein